MKKSTLALAPAIAILSLMMLSCGPTLYKVPTEDTTYSTVINVPNASQQDLYVQTILWFTDKIGDPYSTNASYSKYSAYSSTPYSTKPYFYDIQLDSIIGKLSFLSKDNKDEFYHKMDIATEPERLQVEFFTRLVWTFSLGFSCGW